jgi:hypothetical protein
MDFPLHIGDRWQFSEVPGNYSESCVLRDTTMPNGFTYRQIQGALFSGFYRLEGSKLFNYSPSSNSEGMVYDFSRKRGDTLYFYVSGKDTITNTVYSDGSQTIFGQQRHVMAFLTKHTQTSLYSIYSIADGIGITGYNGEAFSYGLAGAVINGVQFGTVLGVSVNNQSAPIQYILYQNYPNPFNPETNLSFSLKERDYVSLQIFDQLGRQVITLVSDQMSAGLHSITWDAHNIPSGIYYYRITIGNSIQTRSMLLIK